MGPPKPAKRTRSGQRTPFPLRLGGAERTEERIRKRYKRVAGPSRMERRQPLALMGRQPCAAAPFTASATYQEPVRWQRCGDHEGSGRSRSRTQMSSMVKVDTGFADTVN